MSFNRNACHSNLVKSRIPSVPTTTYDTSKLQMRPCKRTKERSLCVKPHRISVKHQTVTPATLCLRCTTNETSGTQLMTCTKNEQTNIAFIYCLHTINCKLSTCRYVCCTACVHFNIIIWFVHSPCSARAKYMRIIV